LSLDEVYEYDKEETSVKQVASTSDFSLCLFFNPVNGGDTFHGSFGGLSTDYTVSYPRRHNSSQSPLRGLANPR
jgi:hypothetical protein